jgi:hypothetical protein
VSSVYFFYRSFKFQFAYPRAETSWKAAKSPRQTKQAMSTSLLLVALVLIGPVVFIKVYAYGTEELATVFTEKTSCGCHIIVSRGGSQTSI